MSDERRFLNLKQYAEHRGVQPESVRHAIKSGKISRGLVSGQRPYKIDPTVADQEWVLEIRLAADPSDTGGVPGIVTTATIAESRARREAADAEFAEIKLAKEKGDLVPSADVLSEWQKVAAITRTKILGLPSKAKQRIHDLTTAQYQTLEMLAREVCEELADESSR